MYSQEKMIKAVMLFIKLDKSPAATIRTLGYPAKGTLYQWYNDYVQYGYIPNGYKSKKPKFTNQQKINAIKHYFDHGQSMAYTMRCLGYPGCRQTFRNWLYEQHPKLFKPSVYSVNRKVFSIEEKITAVTDLVTRTGSAKEIADTIGVSRVCLYNWRNKLLAQKEGFPMKKTIKKIRDTQPNNIFQKNLELEKKNAELRMENDILAKTNELLKKVWASTK